MGWAARDGIVGDYKRLRTRGLSPQQLLVASAPTTALPLTTMSASTRSPAYPWTNEYNTQWDSWQSPIVGHGSVHRQYSLRSARISAHHQYPTPHQVRTRAVVRHARDDVFADALFHNCQWAYSIGLDAKMDVFKARPAEYRDVQLYQWLTDGLYDEKDQQPMDMSERKSQCYTVNGVGMVSLGTRPDVLTWYSVQLRGRSPGTGNSYRVA